MVEPLIARCALAVQVEPMPAALIQAQLGGGPDLPPGRVEQDRIVGLIFVVGRSRDKCRRCGGVGSYGRGVLRLRGGWHCQQQAGRSGTCQKVYSGHEKYL
ncbi:hypothetical protein [uncultured Sphingomonas sp.]|uniref:hypothetical protein n=1 Tax=uncultured Sphingomonas sp. TaxID=158754 RepID=UPI0025DDAC42|nr:hypothetical protein [uncultured Sphingomonas sp.]